MAPGNWGTDGTAAGIWAAEGAAAGEPAAAELADAWGDWLAPGDADAAGEGEASPRFCMAWPAAFCPACWAAPAAAPAAAAPAPCITPPPICARTQSGMHNRINAPMNPKRAFIEVPPELQTCSTKLRETVRGLLKSTIESAQPVFAPINPFDRETISDMSLT